MGMHLRTNKLFSKKIYWINKLSGELPETNLILDYIRPSLSITKNKSLSFDLSHDLSQAIIKLAKGSYFSIYLILVSVLNILLQKYTQNNDVIVGIPIYEKIGTNDLNSKVIPLRTQVIPQLTFKDFLFQVQDSVIGAYSHQNYHFDELIQLLEIPTSPNRCPFFDIIVLLENIHNKNNLNNLNNDITFSFLINSENISANIEYNQHLFKDENIEFISKYYTNVLESIINNVDTKISDVVFLKDSDQHQLLKQYNNNIKDYPVEQTINQLFEQQVSQTPSNIAVIHKETQLTYKELNEKANQLAGLLRKLGVCKGEFVGIFKDRDINFLVAILAIYKAGGAYVPIDSTYPPNRIKYMLSNSEVRCLLTDFSLLNSLSDLREDCSQLSSIICLDDVIPERTLLDNNAELKIYNKFDFYNLSTHNVEQMNDAGDPAYMLYTSGSTGLPKGAIVRHDGAVNHIYAQFDELELTEEFCFLQSAPSSTDISVWQFLAPLFIGGKTVIVDLETVAIPEKLFQVLKSSKITVVELVPALFGSLLEYTSRLAIAERELPSLKWMMVVGEPVSVSWVNKWLQIYPSVKIANAYGPTEAADDITQFIVDKPLPENQRTVPIGKPLANLNLYILDRQMQLLPIGAPGEICVSGIGVGAGYWKNEEKTKLSFVPNPFTDASNNLPANRPDLIYKTGDLGRWLGDGNIEFLGRIDHQVKLRGFRVELGEIEAFLVQHQAVREAVVVVREHNGDDKRLVAYVVPKSEFCQDDATSNQLVQQLRDFLQQKLPGHMVPSAIVLLEALPLAPSGKVDRRALPVPSFKNESELGFVAPRTPTEEIVADIWGQVLKQEHIGIHDNFFDLGGHSLLATQAISRLREAFKLELPLRCLFEAPTVAQLAQLVEGFIRKNNVALVAEQQRIRPVKRQGTLPLSFAQQRLWFIEELTKVSQLFDVPTCLYLKGSLNVTALESSLNEIVRRHEVLRTNFTSVEGRSVQVIHPTLNLTLPIVDFQELPEAKREIEIQRLIDSEASRCFNLTEDPLLRCILLHLSKEEHILLFTIHHIVTDGWSLGVIIRELTTLYEAFCQNQPSPLPELPIQYADFVVWQRQYLQGEVLDNLLTYWKQKLSGNLPVLQLPTDYPRPAIQSFSGKRKSFFLSPDLTQALKILSRDQNTTLFMTLLAGFKTLLHRYSGQEDILVGSPIANRNQDEIEQLIGFFVNTLVLRTNFSGNPSFQELLRRIRETTLGAYAHQDMPFELLVQELEPQRNLSHTPLFQVMFVLHNAPIPALEMPGLALTPLETNNNRNVMFDLTLHMTEVEGGIVASLDYNTDLFEENTICRMAGHLQTLLEAVVANPQQRLSELPLLREFEQHQLLREWNHTEVEYPQQQCIHQLFEAQVERTPDAVAVVFESEQLSYHELNKRANQLAHYLRSWGVKPEVLVGICLERSLS
ncbi:non-ribosomal peptide synthetase, partial [Fischerella sp. PCC 9605]|uniref:non-ribosomal peptide synthetase n=1 Tax=Fischerella sp. PCC 9605 TaxID=1173024 RepID=UPI0009E224E7